MRSSDTPDPVRRSSAHVLVDEPVSLEPTDLVVSSEIEHHLVRVLRISTGETVSATDGTGSWRLYEASVDGGALVLTASGDVGHCERPGEPLSIATAIPKGDRVDWLVQKATELGVDRITMLHTDRSVVRWKTERAAKQIAKLQRVADEALRQSRRLWRVAVSGPVDALDVLATHVIAEPGGRTLTSTDRTIAIGPEGGWSERELSAAGEGVRLGHSILRTETAAIAATTLSQFLSN